MSESCVSKSKGDPAQKLREAHDCLKQFEKAIHAMTATVNDIEDEYREAGMHYHKSEYEARYYLTAEERQEVETFFETSRVEDYNAIFADLTNMMDDLMEVRAKYVRFPGTSEEIFHRIFVNIQPALLEADIQINHFKLRLLEPMANACRIASISQDEYDTDEHRRYRGWHQPSGRDVVSNPVPILRGLEWQTYRAWVWSLPETQRATEAGRTLNEVCLNLLYREPEGMDDAQAE